MNRNFRQIRAIKNYAHAMRLDDIEVAALRWCETGLARRWAEGEL